MLSPWISNSGKKYCSAESNSEVQPSEPLGEKIDIYDKKSLSAHPVNKGQSSIAWWTGVSALLAEWCFFQLSSDRYSDLPGDPDKYTQSSFHIIRLAYLPRSVCLFSKLYLVSGRGRENHLQRARL